MSGWFKLHRGWMDSPDFAPEPFTEREAWLWLVEHAAYEPHKRYVSGQAIELARGQVLASQRNLSDIWKWGRQRVRGFIAKLERTGSITQNSTHGLTQITICNYAHYQDVQPTEQPSSNPAATQQQPIKEEDKEDKEEKKKGFALPEWVPAAEWSDYIEMRNRIRKPMTDKAKQLAIAELETLAKQGHSPEFILNQSVMNSWQGIFAPSRKSGKVGVNEPIHT